MHFNFINNCIKSNKKWNAQNPSVDLRNDESMVRELIKGKEKFTFLAKIGLAVWHWMAGQRGLVSSLGLMRRPLEMFFFFFQEKWQLMPLGNRPPDPKLKSRRPTAMTRRDSRVITHLVGYFSLIGVFFFFDCFTLLVYARSHTGPPTKLLLAIIIVVTSTSFFITKIFNIKNNTVVALCHKITKKNIIFQITLY